MFMENILYAFIVAVAGVFAWTAALITAFWLYSKVRKKKAMPIIKSLSD